MDKRNFQIWAGILLLFLLLLGASHNYINGSQDEKKPVPISVVLYGDNPDRWVNLRQGCAQAAGDLKAEVRYVTLQEEWDSEEQVEAIRKELENGAKGLLLAVTDSQAMIREIEQFRIQVPIVFIENGIEDGSENPDTTHVTCISADDYEMGRALAELLLQNLGQNEKIAVVAEHFFRESVSERYQGFTEVLEEQGKDHMLWKRGAGDFKLDLFLASMMKTDSSVNVVALDDNCLESALEARIALNSRAADSWRVKKQKIYGIGGTNQIVSGLDQRILSGIVVQNEFNVGYVGLERLLEEIQGQKIHSLNDDQIEFGVITWEDMYEKENQRLLFPIVQ